LVEKARRGEARGMTAKRGSGLGRHEISGRRELKSAKGGEKIGDQGERQAMAMVMRSADECGIHPVLGRKPRSAMKPSMAVWNKRTMCRRLCYATMRHIPPSATLIVPPTDIPATTF